MFVRSHPERSRMIERLVPVDLNHENYNLNL